MPAQKSVNPKKAFPLRIEHSLYEALERTAAGEFRSVNAQVEVLLREALARRGVKIAPPEKRKRGRPPVKKGNSGNE